MSARVHRLWLTIGAALLATGGVGLVVLPVQWNRVDPAIRLLGQELNLGWQLFEMIGRSVRMLATADTLFSLCAVVLLAGVVTLGWSLLRFATARPPVSGGKVTRLSSDVGSLFKAAGPVLVFLLALGVAIAQGNVQGFLGRQAEQAVGMMVVGLPVAVVLLVLLWWWLRTADMPPSDRRSRALARKLDELLALSGAVPPDANSPLTPEHKLDLVLIRLKSQRS